MKRIIVILFAGLCLSLAVSAQKVTVHAVNQPAAGVFRSIMEQTGKNFVYSSDVLKDLVITVDADNESLKKVLSKMFDGTAIEYKIKGNNVVLKRKTKKLPSGDSRLNSAKDAVTPSASIPKDAKMLEEVVVVSRLEAPVVETAEIGAKKLTPDEVRRLPALLGERDVIKTLQFQPGVVQGTEGMAGMHVHGGNADENQYMLDNVPIYQVNHFAGLFSAFNPEIIRYVDFFKSSFPARYEGRLSSFMDVRLKTGIPEGHHGSARLGLTSGAFNLSGPLGRKTSYLVGLRRSWYDVLTLPALAILNAKTTDEKVRFRYYFMDLNARVNHYFNNRLNAFVSAYYGNDFVQTGNEDKVFEDTRYYEKDHYDFNWGNLVVQTGINYRFNPSMSSEFTAAYTRYFSDMKHQDFYRITNSDVVTVTDNRIKTDNNINDWIFKADFDWQPNDRSRIRFGAGYTRHSFLPSRTVRQFTVDDNIFASRDSSGTYAANELNAYIEDDWKISKTVRMNAGLHFSGFDIDRKMHSGVSPRLSLAWQPTALTAVKAGYSHTTQYVHQLTMSYLSLPTDQWIPVTGNFKPQTADKIFAGFYWQTPGGDYAVSAEGYMKWMHNLIEYRDEYYLRPPLESWNSQLTAGRGSSKGIDLKLEKRAGKVTGHISYSLAWADRTFAEKNGGLTYPARFDNRHMINIVANWAINNKVELSAAWVGHSGNRCTFLPQMWEGWNTGNNNYHYNIEVPLRAKINDYQLPFYHRLDLACTVRNSRGYWTFGLYNAYCHLNTIGVRCGYKDRVSYGPNNVVWYHAEPVFQKVKLLPVIPSVSYTWQF